MKETLKQLKEDMIDFIVPGETAYSNDDVEECLKIISNFLQKIKSTNSKEEGMQIVKNIVISLNDLNEKCEYELIETDQRELIAEIIISAGNQMGFNSKDEDITEDWREW